MPNASRPRLPRHYHGLLSVLLATACSTSSPHPDDLRLREAYLAREAGHIDQATSIAEELTLREHRHDEARELLAALHRNQAHQALTEERFHDAYEGFLLAAEHSLVTHRRARDLRGALDAGEHLNLDPSTKLTILTRLLESDPRDLDLHLATAHLAEDLERFELATHHYLHIYSARPDDLHSGLRLGILFLELNRPLDAAAILEPIHTRQPDNIQAAFNLITAWESLGRTTELEALLQRLLAQHPERPAIYHRYARFLESQGRSDEASQQRQKALEHSPAIKERQMRPLR